MGGSEREKTKGRERGGGRREKDKEDEWSKRGERKFSVE